MGKPTRSEVLKLVDYDPINGAMTWRKRDATQIANTTGVNHGIQNLLANELPTTTLMAGMYVLGLALRAISQTRLYT